MTIYLINSATAVCTRCGYTVAALLPSGSVTMINVLDYFTDLGWEVVEIGNVKQHRCPRCVERMNRRAEA